MKCLALRVASSKFLRLVQRHATRLALVTALMSASMIFASSESALAASPTVSIMPTSLSFVAAGSQLAGTPQLVTVTNTGSVPVELDGAGVTCGPLVPCVGGTNAGDFSISNDECSNGTTIPVGMACTFDVAFTPSSVSVERADIYVGDNASGSPQVVPARGTYEYVRTSPADFHDVTSVPLSIFNTVGIKSPIAVSRLTVMHDQPPFRYGKLAGSFSWTAEYCPYCAATRWGLIVALSRFGHFNQLYDMTSSPTDIYPNTPTFTFFMSTYTSSFLVFRGYEIENMFGQPHMKTPARITKLVQTYNSFEEFPFLDFGNTAFLTGSAWSPEYLSGQTRDAVAAGLSNPSLRLTKAIVAEANFISSAICGVDGERPAKVCLSSGVIKADKAQHLPT